MSAPALIVRFEIESRPRVYIDATTEGQHDRLRDWLESVDDLADLLDHLECVCQAWSDRRAA